MTRKNSLFQRLIKTYERNYLKTLGINKIRCKNTCWMLSVAAFVGFASCSDDSNHNGGSNFSPDQPIVINEFYPDSGGIATPMILEGTNFGTDTLGMRVYFQDVDGIKHRAGLVSSTGSKVYLFVPSGLTYKKEMNILVERTLPDGKICEGKAADQFMYKTQTSVSTVVGLVSTDNNNLPTVGGDLATSTLSAPGFICLDDQDNIFITEHTWWGGSTAPVAECRNDKGEAVQGNIVMASLKSNSVVVLKYGALYVNAPAFSDEKDNESVYIPDDAGSSFYNLIKNLSYAPRYLTMIKSEESADIDEKNWKHSFVVNRNDRYIYTIMTKGQLVRINPKTRTIKILLKQVGNVPNGSDYYLAFSPIKGQEDMLYACMGSANQIWRIDVSKLKPEDRDTYHGEPYAGKAMVEGVEGGRGWEDGLLKNARFNGLHQICFTGDGKLYIADTGNACIRVIDTTLPKDKATVSTPIGLPGAAGYKDGGPDIAKFNKPVGVAVSADGRIVYVADTQNKVIRKLSIE